MLKRKDIAMCVVATILTCGIYGLFWLVSIADDINELDEAQERDNISGGMVLIFSLLTCGIYKIYWAYKTGEKIDRMKNDRGISTSNNTAIIYLILCVLSYFVGVTGIVMYALIQDEINKFMDMQQ